MQIDKITALEKIKLTRMLLDETEKEIKKVRYERLEQSLNGEWSLGKIKRNCVTMRETLLEVKKGCEWDYDE